MATRDFSTYTLYRWRYVIGYSAIVALLAALLLFAGLYLPGGLSQTEMGSVVTSASLSLSDPSTLAIPNLPYYAFQSLIFGLFGVTTLTVKLPSLIFALFSALGLVLLLRRWFKPNIAILSSLIAISTGQFLFIAQSGTPSVLYIFWPIVLLLLGTQITRVKQYRFLWKILFAICAALSLYTPLGVYPLLAVGLAIVFHPHLRAIIRRLSRTRLIVMGAIFTALTAPLMWLATVNPRLIPDLLGAPTTWPPDLGANTLTVLKQYFLFWQPSATEIMTPVFGLGSSLIIGLGLYRLIRTRDTTRSYLIIFWMVCIIPVLLLNPIFTTVSFLPSVLMMAAGLMSLISYWYRLFPLNPYARVTGLVPIIILVGALIGSGLARYAYGYHYSPTTVPLFSVDLKLLPKETTQIVAGEDEHDFYVSVAKYRDGIEVVTKPTADSFVATREAHRVYNGYTISRIITNQLSSDADRLYVYERTSTAAQ